MVAGLLSIVLIGWSALLALLVLMEALNGSRYVQWSADPGVWWGELVLAACSAVIAVVTAVLVSRRSRDGFPASAKMMLGIGLGFLAVGGLGYLVGLLGLRVPMTGAYDALERSEYMFILGGIIAAVLGALVTIGSIFALGLRDRRD